MELTLEYVAEVELSLAREIIEQEGTEVPPHYLLWNEQESKVTSVLCKFRNTEEKRLAAKATRLVALRERATYCLYLGEAWMVHRPREEIDCSPPPSQCPDRDEALLRLGRGPEGSKIQTMWPILKSAGRRWLGEECPMPGMEFDRLTEGVLPPPEILAKTADQDLNMQIGLLLEFVRPLVQVTTLDLGGAR